MNILITLCARGGSKGIPYKNIKLLNGIPLICYSLKIAREFKYTLLTNSNINVDIELSTDDDKIKKVAKQHGLITNYIRPDILANDFAGKIDVIKDIYKYSEIKNKVKYDFVLDLDISSPLRNLEDLIVAYNIISSNNDAINLFSVNNANKNPYFNLVEENEKGYYDVSKKLNTSVLSRQMAPKVYELNASFYFYKSIFFEQNYKSVYTGKCLIYEMPHICFDIDHPIDFDFMEYLIINNKLNFNL